MENWAPVPHTEFDISHYLPVTIVLHHFFLEVRVLDSPYWLQRRNYLDRTEEVAVQMTSLLFSTACPFKSNSIKTMKKVTTQFHYWIWNNYKTDVCFYKLEYHKGFSSCMVELLISFILPPGERPRSDSDPAKSGWVISATTWTIKGI